MADQHSAVCGRRDVKELFVPRDADFVVKVECGSGGGPKGVVQKTIRLRSSRAYDKCYVLVDSDRPFEPDNKLEERVRKKSRVEILKSTPCVEGVFLAILQHRNFSQTSATSDCCKWEFEANYISADKKTDKRAYAEHFTGDVIRNRRAVFASNAGLMTTGCANYYALRGANGS